MGKINPGRWGAEAPTLPSEHISKKMGILRGLLAPRVFSLRAGDPYFLVDIVDILDAPLVKDKPRRGGAGAPRRWGVEALRRRGFPANTI